MAERKEYLVSEELLRAIANYLGQKPYMEVVGLISELQQLVPHQPLEEPNGGKQNDD